MRDMFKFQYNPALHDGEVNNDNNVFTYVGKIIDHFSNVTEGETFSGLTIELHGNEFPFEKTGEIRRFRFDRIVKTENVENAKRLHYDVRCEHSRLNTLRHERI